MRTESSNVEEKITKNGKRLLSAVCKICGRKKSQFMSKTKTLTEDQQISGSGIFNNLLSTLGNTVGEMHIPAAQGEYVPNGSFNNLQKYSYCGPGTKYEQRNKEGYQGVNELDKMCKLHDQFYNENSDTASRNIRDEALAHRAYEIANDSRYDSAQRNMATLVYYIMKNKAKFGLGVNSKNLKKGLMKRK